MRAVRALSGDEEAAAQVGGRAEGSAEQPGSAGEAQLDDSGFVDFTAAGVQVSGEFRCADCGYGAVVHNALPPCPMCGGTVWESRAPLAPPPAS